VWVNFTDQPHPNVGAIDGVFLDLYVPIVETQTWWQVLSNGPSVLAALINNTLGVVTVQFMNKESSTGTDPAKQIAAVREQLRRRADMSA
jgi:ABC-type sugar transport system substrate-binding protein